MAETVGALLIEAAISATAGGTITGSLVGGATSLSIAGVSLSASVIGSLALGAAAVGLSFALTPQVKQPKAADALLSIRQPNPVRQGGYGRDRVAGAYMFYDASVTGAGQYWSADVMALVGGRICGVRQFLLNDDVVTLSGGNVIGLPDGRYWEAGTPRIGMESRVGLPTETAYGNVTSVFGSKWTTAHRGDGIASLQLICAQCSNVNTQTACYPNGLPKASAVCDLYPLWDPRDPAQDPDNPATWFPAAWSAGTTYAAGARVSFGSAQYYSYAGGNIGFQPDQRPDKWNFVLGNPVLQLIDYVTNADHGMGLDRDVVIMPHLATLMAKADLCDVLIADKAGNLTPRYASAGTFNFDDDPADVIGAILATCDGWLTEDGEGALMLEVGVYSDPAVTLEGRHILGGSINYGVADEAAVNELTLTFTSPDFGYKEAPGDPWRNNDDISVRGRVRSQQLALKFVQRHSQARRLAKRAMARLSAVTGTLTTRLYGLRALGERWARIKYPLMPGMDDIVVELAKATVNFLAGTVTFDWSLVDPATIDAWDPATEEGDAPAVS